MQRKLSNKGFSVVEGIIAISIIIALGFGGVWLSYHHDNNSGKESISRQKSVTKLSSYTFPIEKIHVEYDKSWTAGEIGSEPTNCGPSDSMTLKRQDFAIGFNFGTICGKGTDCDAAIGCLVESKNLATIHLLTTKQAFIVVSRLTTDNGQSWEYSVNLLDSPKCLKSICTITPINLGKNPGASTVSGSFYAAGSGGASSLDEYAELPDIKAATEVLKTAHY